MGTLSARISSADVFSNVDQDYPNGIPGSLVQPFRRRTIWASDVLGLTQGCNMATGLDSSGNSYSLNTGKGYANALNAVLATATPSNPLHLIMDIGVPIGKALVVATHTKISGHGWQTGIFLLPGANCNGIQNFAGTDLASYQAWNPPTRPQPIVGSDITLSHFKIHCNAGVFPNGNCNGGKDGTLDDYIGTGPSPGYNPNVRGSYTGSWLLTGIIMTGVDGLRMDGIQVFDPPTFHVNLYHCMNFVADACHLEALDPTVLQNTDGFHLNGGCSRPRITNCYFRCGDDSIGINLEEGDGSDGSDFIIDNCVLDNSLNAGRVYGLNSAHARRVSFTNIYGTVQNEIFNIGYEAGVPYGVERNHEVYFGNCKIGLTTANFRNSFVWVNSSIGTLTLDHCTFDEPIIAAPMVYMGLHSPTISSLKLNHCSIHRNATGNAAAYAFLGSTGSIVKDFTITGFEVTEQEGASYADIPNLINVGGGTIRRLGISASLRGVGTVVYSPAGSTLPYVDIADLTHQSNAGSPSNYTVVAAGSTVNVSLGRYRAVNTLGVASGAVLLSGPGLISCGLQVPDSLVANGVDYFSSTQGARAFKDFTGTVNPYPFGAATAYTLAGPTTGIVSVASGNFTVTPNHPYTGTITITPSGGGLSTPIVKTFSNSSAPQTFTITPTATGTVTLTGTNSGGLSNPTAASYVASAGSTAAQYAGVFNGSNYLSAANFTGNQAAFSVACWFNLFYVQSQRIFFSNYEESSGHGWAVGMSDATANKLKFYLGSATLEATTVASASAWHHAVFTYDGTTAKIYLDGNTTPDATLTGAVIYGSVPTNNYVGTLNGTIQDVDGSLAGVGEWSRALTSSEAATLYNGGTGLAAGSVTGGLATGLVAYYDFANSGTPGADGSGNGHNLTNTGAVTRGNGPGSPPTVRMRDTFTGTAGTSVTAHTPDVPTGSDAYSLASGNLVIAPGGGLVSSGTGTDFWCAYPLTGVGGAAEYRISFVTSNPVVLPTFYFRTSAIGDLSHVIAIDLNYTGTSKVDLLVIDPSITTINTGYPIAIATNTTYTLDLLIGATSVSGTLNGILIFRNITIPAFAASMLHLRQQGGAAGDLKIISVTVQN